MKSKKNQTKKITRKVSQQKLKELKELIALIEKNSTIAISSIENLPSKQLQKIRHILRGKIIIKTVKKSLALRAFDEAKKENIKELSNSVEKNSAILFSDIDPFEIAGILA